MFTIELHCIDIGGLSAANWDGIRDNETGILIFTWTVGTTVCGEDVVEYNDPHEHLSTRSDWTHVGLAFPLKLAGNRRIQEYHSWSFKEAVFHTHHSNKLSFLRINYTYVMFKYVCYVFIYFSVLMEQIRLRCQTRYQ